MQVKVTDANGVQQTVLLQGLEAVVDHSGAIVTTAASQLCMTANPLRSGFFVQNTSNRVQWVNELGAASAVAASYQLQPGAVFPPPGYPVTTGAVNILGTTGDTFTSREW